MPATLILDHVTPRAAATALLTELASAVERDAPTLPAEVTRTRDGVAPPPATPSRHSQAVRPPRTFDLLPRFASACSDGRLDEGFALLADAANLRPAVGDTAPIDPVVFCRDGAPPALICLPSVVAPSNAYQYARFAMPFRGIQPLFVLPYPGFTLSSPLPATRADIITERADAVLRAAAGMPFVLVGYSSGGWIAHAVAERLVETGYRPAGLVLLDCHLPGSASLAHIQSVIFGQMYQRGQTAEVRADDAELTAMVRYLLLFEGWRPAPTDVPTLCVTATADVSDPSTESVSGGSSDLRWRADWPLAHSAVEVPADHLTLIERSAASTADHVRRWLDDQPHKVADRAAEPLDRLE